MKDEIPDTERTPQSRVSRSRTLIILKDGSERETEATLEEIEFFQFMQQEATRRGLVFQCNIAAFLPSGTRPKDVLALDINLEATKAHLLLEKYQERKTGT